MSSRTAECRMKQQKPGLYQGFGADACLGMFQR